MIDVGGFRQPGGAGGEDEQRPVLDGEIGTLRGRQSGAIEGKDRLVEARVAVGSVRFAVQPDARGGLAIGI